MQIGVCNASLYRGRTCWIQKSNTQRKFKEMIVIKNIYREDTIEVLTLTTISIEFCSKENCIIRGARPLKEGET